jgi:hypothetical protein
MNHLASPGFWQCYRALPVEIRSLADKNFQLLREDPSHPSLHFKKVGRYRSAFPLSGQMVPEYQREDVREIIEYSYRILYQVGDSTISILTLIHGAHLLPSTPPRMDG